MPNADGRIRRRVLHVAEAAGPFSAAVEQAVASADAELVTVPDVYRALAGLLRPPGEGYDAVVVCLDGMEVAEGEFFSLVARLPASISMMVYGRAGHPDLLAEALARGGVEVRDAAAVPAMIERRSGTARAAAVQPTSSPEVPVTPTPPAATPEPPARVDGRVAAPVDVTTRPQVEPERPAEDALEPPDEPEPEPISEAEPSDEPTELPSEPDGAPPVPWAPPAQRPQRRAPAPATSEPVNRAEEGEQPLLTEEELRALLGGHPPGSDPARSGEGGYPE